MGLHELITTEVVWRIVEFVTASDVLEELGRGSIRPTVRAKRRATRQPLAGARAARAGKRVTAAEKSAATRRAPLAELVPRQQKRKAGRTTAAQTPAHIRSMGGLLDADDRDYLRRKLGMKLGKYASSIERTSVRVEDVNGPRGGIDKRCRIKAVLTGLPSVVVEHRHHSLQVAIDRALDRIERAVRSATQRRRMKPLKSRTGSTAASI